MLIIYGIGKPLDGEKAGLVAALLWACLPLDIFLASDLLADGPVTAFSASAIYFFLLAERDRSPKRGAWFMAGGFCLLWAILIKPIAIVTLFFTLFYIVLKSWPKFLSFLKRKNILNWLSTHRKQVASFGGVLIFVLFVGYAQLQSRPLIVNASRAATDLSRVLITGETDIDLSNERVGQIGLFSILGPAPLCFLL